MNNGVLLLSAVNVLFLPQADQSVAAERGRNDGNRDWKPLTQLTDYHAYVASTDRYSLYFFVQVNFGL